MAQPPSGGGSGSSSADADPHGQPTVPDPGVPGDPGAEAARGSAGQDQVTRTWWAAGPATPPHPPHPPTEVDSPHPPTDVDRSHAPTEVDSGRPAAGAASPFSSTVTGGLGSGAPGALGGGRAGPASEWTVSAVGPAGEMRFGPGVPASSPPGGSGPAADQVWRTGQLPAPPPRRRLRRTASGAVTVALLAAAGVVLFLRFHHGPLRVTGVAITGQVTRGCAEDVTGRIATNGSAGTVSYQWLFQPQLAAPQPMNQSVVSGQDAVYVTVAVEGGGQGTASQTVTLQVLGPGSGTASVHVVVSC